MWNERSRRKGDKGEYEGIPTFNTYRVPVYLADKTVVYSEGMGDWHFKPTSESASTMPRDVVLSRALHVPALQNNLLSVLHLTKCHEYSVAIDSTQMRFHRRGSCLFTASIEANASLARLNGSIHPTNEFACLTSSINTLSHDLELWHCRFAHHSLPTIKSMASKGSVTGMCLDNASKPDPICEPCLAGKMSANPFPAREERSSTPLELIHTDLHQLKSRTHDGYKFWVTFIDDCTEWRAVIFLKAKSQAFDAFKTYKSYAENALGRKIKFLQYDKGGEYWGTLAFKCAIQLAITLNRTVLLNALIAPLTSTPLLCFHKQSSLLHS